MDSQTNKQVPNYRPSPRAGLTLTELLVVIAILVVVTSVLAPLLTSSLEGREVREAARQINAYFQQAQAKARQLGRPVGVVLQRSPNIDQDYAYQLSLAEQPPPFRGLTSADRATIRVATSGSGKIATTFYPKNQGDPAGIAGIVMPGMGSPLGFLRVVQPNDEIRFNFRGPKYRIVSVEQTGNFYPDPTFLITFLVDPSDTTTYVMGNSVPFEIFRRPRMSASTPLELPAGTAILMNYSGVGLDFASNSASGIETQVSGINPRQQYIGLTEFQRLQPDKTLEGFPGDFPDAVYSSLRQAPLTIMFSPDGSIDRIYRVLPPAGMLAPANLTFLAQVPPKRPQDKLYLFVGKDALDTMESTVQVGTEELGVNNYLDTTNLWIAIDPQTGLVTTSPHVPDPSIDPSQGMKRFLGAIAVSRQIAASGQSMGGQ